MKKYYLFLLPTLILCTQQNLFGMKKGKKTAPNTSNVSMLLLAANRLDSEPTICSQSTENTVLLEAKKSNSEFGVFTKNQSSSSKKSQNKRKRVDSKKKFNKKRALAPQVAPSLLSLQLSKCRGANAKRAFLKQALVDAGEDINELTKIIDLLDSRISRPSDFYNYLVEKPGQTETSVLQDIVDKNSCIQFKTMVRSLVSRVAKLEKPGRIYSRFCEDLNKLSFKDSQLDCAKFVVSCKNRLGKTSVKKDLQDLLSFLDQEPEQNQGTGSSSNNQQNSLSQPQQNSNETTNTSNLYLMPSIESLGAEE